MATTMKMKIDAEEFRVSPAEGVALGERLTRVKAFCTSQHQYKKLLEHRMESLTEVQRLHYASGR